MKTGEEEPALFTQPHRSATSGAGMGTGGGQAVGPVGGTTKTIRPIGGPEQPTGEANTSEDGRHSRDH